MRGCLFQPYAELVAVPWRADLEQRNRFRRFPGASSSATVIGVYSDPTAGSSRMSRRRQGRSTYKELRE